MIIDAHLHVGRWDHADFLGRDADLARALEVLTDAGIDGAAVCPTDRRDNDGLVADARAALARGYPGRLWLFPWVRPMSQGGQADLDWLARNHASVAGIKIHPSLSRVRVSDPDFAPLLAHCERAGLAVLVHCGRWQEMASYRFALDAAAAHPAGRFILAHAGGDTPPLATAAAAALAERGLDNAWFEISGLREYWVLQRNIARLGAGRYLLGSDYNLAHPSMYVAAVRALGLPDADTARVLGGNALEVLGSPLAA